MYSTQCPKYWSHLIIHYIFCHHHRYKRFCVLIRKKLVKGNYPWSTKTMREKNSILCPAQTLDTNTYTLNPNAEYVQLTQKLSTHYSTVEISFVIFINFAKKYLYWSTNIYFFNFCLHEIKIFYWVAENVNNHVQSIPFSYLRQQGILIYTLFAHKLNVLFCS